MKRRRMEPPAEKGAGKGANDGDGGCPEGGWPFSGQARDALTFALSASSLFQSGVAAAVALPPPSLASAHGVSVLPALLLNTGDNSAIESGLSHDFWWALAVARHQEQSQAEEQLQAAAEQASQEQQAGKETCDEPAESLPDGDYAKAGEDDATGAAAEVPLPVVLAEEEEEGKQGQDEKADGVGQQEDAPPANAPVPVPAASVPASQAQAMQMPMPGLKDTRARMEQKKKRQKIDFFFQKAGAGASTANSDALPAPSQATSASAQAAAPALPAVVEWPIGFNKKKGKPSAALPRLSSAASLAASGPRSVGVAAASASGSASAADSKVEPAVASSANAAASASAAAGATMIEALALEATAPIITPAGETSVITGSRARSLNVQTAAGSSKTYNGRFGRHGKGGGGAGAGRYNDDEDARDDDYHHHDIDIEHDGGTVKVFDPYATIIGLAPPGYPDTGSSTGSGNGNENVQSAASASVFSAAPVTFRIRAGRYRPDPPPPLPATTFSQVPPPQAAVPAEPAAGPVVAAAHEVPQAQPDDAPAQIVAEDTAPAPPVPAPAPTADAAAAPAELPAGHSGNAGDGNDGSDDVDIDIAAVLDRASRASSASRRKGEEGGGDPVESLLASLLLPPAHTEPLEQGGEEGLAGLVEAAREAAKSICIPPPRPGGAASGPSTLVEQPTLPPSWEEVEAGATPDPRFNTIVTSMTMTTTVSPGGDIDINTSRPAVTVTWADVAFVVEKLYSWLLMTSSSTSPSPPPSERLAMCVEGAAALLFRRPQSRPSGQLPSRVFSNQSLSQKQRRIKPQLACSPGLDDEDDEENGDHDNHDTDDADDQASFALSREQAWALAVLAALCERKHASKHTGSSHEGTVVMDGVQPAASVA